MKLRSFILIPVLFALMFLTACERSEVNGIGSYTPDAVAPPQLDAAVGSCVIGASGRVAGHGLVVNPTAGVATYEIVIAFEDDDLRLGQGSAWIRDLDSGQTVSFDAAAHLGDRSGSMTGCRVITANRRSPERV